MSEDEQEAPEPAPGEARDPRTAYDLYAADQKAELDAKFAKLRLVAGDASRAHTKKFAHLLKADPIPPLLSPSTVAALQQMATDHDQRMAPIRAMIDNGVLDDMQRIAASMAPALAQAKAASAAVDAVFTPQMRLMFEQMNRTHRSLFAQLDLAFPMNPVIAGEVVMGSQAVEHDTALPGMVPTITSVPVRSRPKISREQQLALVVALAGLHSYAMDLRRADLADAGTLALIVALLLVVLALQSEEAE